MVTRSFVDVADLSSLPPPLSEETALKERGLGRTEITFSKDAKAEELIRTVKKYLLQIYHSSSNTVFKIPDLVGFHAFLMLWDFHMERFIGERLQRKIF